MRLSEVLAAIIVLVVVGGAGFFWGRNTAGEPAPVKTVTEVKTVRDTIKVPEYIEISGDSTPAQRDTVYLASDTVYIDSTAHTHTYEYTQTFDFDSVGFQIRARTRVNWLNNSAEFNLVPQQLWISRTFTRTTTYQPSPYWRRFIGGSLTRVPGGTIGMVEFAMLKNRSLIHLGVGFQLRGTMSGAASLGWLYNFEWL